MLSAVDSIRAWKRNSSSGGLGTDILSLLSTATVSGIPLARGAAEVAIRTDATAQAITMRWSFLLERAPHANLMLPAPVVRMGWSEWTGFRQGADL